MNRFHLAAVSFLVLVPLALPAGGQTCPVPQSPPACTEAGTVNQWQCWQKTLRSGGYTATNAYRELEITVEYRNASTNALVRSGWGFWDCRETSGQEAFRLRTALPAGSYKWEAKCRKRAGAPAATKDCATDVNLNGPAFLAGGSASGTFTVNAVTVANDRYDRGFLTPGANRKFLKQGSTTVPFFWLADTAWPAGKLASRATDWATYLDGRKKQGFSVVLLGTAPRFGGPSCLNGGPCNGGVTEAEAFEQIPSPTCVADGTPVPNNCSRWNPLYWQQVEAKIQDANAKGLVVAVAGIMEPFAYSTNPTYGSPTSLSLFARNLAARLAGHHVVFSPGFDQELNATSLSMANSVGTTIDQAVGTTLVSTAPAHLVTHHLAGKATCADYKSNFQSQIWHDFHLFQSGHCAGLRIQIQPGQEQLCDPRRDYPPHNLNQPGPEDETATACVTRRAKTVAADLFTGSPIKPSVNGEAAYDANPTSPGSTPAPDNRFYVRQSAYLTALSGSFGFTYGAHPFSLWTVTTSNLASNLGPVPGTPGTVPPAQTHSAWDMQRMASIFKIRRWKELVPEPLKILNQQTVEEKKMAYARSSDYSFALAFAPDDGLRDRIYLDMSGRSPAFSCGSTAWTVTWISPRNGTTGAPSGCINTPTGTAKFEIVKPSTCSNCEWVLAIDRTGAKGDEETLSVSDFNELQVWPELTDEGASVRGRVLPAAGKASFKAPVEDVTLSQAQERFFRKQPFVARDGGGSFLVVWESEHQDGSLWGVFGRRFDNLGRPLGDEFQVNSYTYHDQAEPAAAALPAGDAVVVWMSFDQDGDRGGVFGQRYDSKGRPDGSEFQVNSTTDGHQGSPLVGMSARGDFVVAWESEGQDGDGLGIFAQRFDRLGLPQGPESRVSPGGAVDQVLADLQVRQNGDFEVAWYDYDSAGNLLGLRSRRFISDGEAKE